MSSRSDSAPRSPYVTLVTAVLLVSVGAILVRLAQAPPLAVSFYRMSIACVILLPFAWGDARRSWPALDRRSHLLLVAAGVALALHFATWIASLSHTSVAASVLLVNTAPLFATVMSRVFLGEKPPVAVQVAIPVAMAGAALIAFGEGGSSPASLFGNLLAVVGAVTLATYQVIGRGLRGALPLNAYMLAVWGTAVVTLAALAVAFGTPFGGFPLRTWLAFTALAVVPTLGGHGLANRALRSLPAPTVGLFLLGEPVIASLLAYLIFGETPGAATLVGGAVVLAALALVLGRRP
ncbi:MAG TPA: DMT family transporter [Vicinamibacteria bacterium]